MKQFYLGIIILFVNPFTFGQVSEFPVSILEKIQRLEVTGEGHSWDYKSFKTGQNSFYREKLDSTLWYDYESGSKALEMKEVFTYDPQGQLSLAEGYFWNDSKNVFELECKIGKKYPASNEEEVYLYGKFEEYGNLSPELYAKYHFYSDNQDYDTLILSYAYYENRWYPLEKTRRKPDAFHRDTLMVYSQYDFFTEKWIYITKNTKKYNEEGNLIEEIDNDWNDTTSEWIPANKTTWEFSGNTKTRTKFNWVEMNWEYSRKQVGYLSTKGFDSVQFFYDYDATQQVWDDVGKDYYFQNELGEDTLVISYNAEGLPYSRIVTQFDGIGNMTYYKLDNWNKQDSSWIFGGWAYGVSYDETVNLDQVAYFRNYRDEFEFCVSGEARSGEILWDKNYKVLEYKEYLGDENIASQSVDFFYSVIEHTGIEEETIILTYPNPVQDILHVNLPSQEEIEYSVYDLQGKLVRNGYMEDNTISFENLHRGMYILKLKTNEIIKTGKVLKN